MKDLITLKQMYQTIAYLTIAQSAVQRLLPKFLRRLILSTKCVSPVQNSIEGTKVNPEWFQDNYPDWSLVLRESTTGGFYFLFNKWDPNKGIIWFNDNLECRLERMKIEEVPEGIKGHLALMSLFVVEPPPMPELSERQRQMLRTQLFRY